MRIAIIANSYDPTFGAAAGGHVHFLQVAKLWQEAQITIFAPEPMRRPFLTAVPRAAFVAMPSFERFTNNVRIDALLKALFSFRRLPQLRQSDVILATSHFLADVVPAILAKRRKSAVIVWHVLPPPAARTGNVVVNALAYASERLALLLVRRCIPTIIVGSRWMAHSLGLEGPGKDVFVTTNGVDHLLAPQTQNVQLRAGALYLGRVHPSKGVEDLIRAWALLPPQCEGETLTIAGDCSPDYRGYLDAVARALGVEARLRFTGPVSEDDKWRLMTGSKVFTFAGREEGWGIALAEAMAAGLPCVTYDLPIFREIFPNGRQGVAVGDIAAFANKVAELLMDEIKRATFANQARGLAESFSWQRAASVECAALQKAARS